MKTLFKVILFALPVALTACGTTPASQYFLLSAQARELPQGVNPSLGVGPVDIPAYLNRHSMVYNKNDNELRVASFERWAEPLDSAMVRVIRLNLASMLNTQDVQAYPWSKKQQPEYGIEVVVLSFDTEDGAARLIVEWHIRKPRSNTTLMRRIDKFSQRLPEGTVTGAGIAPAYSNLLFQLSEVIAAAISADYDNHKAD